MGVISAIGGRRELVESTKSEGIKRIVVFAGPAFRQITGASTASVKGWRGSVKYAVDHYLEDRDAAQYKSALSRGRTKAGFSTSAFRAR